MPRHLSLSAEFDIDDALAKLAKADPKLGKLIRRVGDFGLKPEKKRTTFQWLLRSVIFQQLHGRAAATIHSRVQALFDGRDPLPEELLAMDPKKLAGAGLSRQKLAALLDLARAAKEGRVPDRRAMSRMHDEEIIASLVPIRGIGRWTVEMLLIFGLGRVDVLATGDFAIQKSTMLLHGLKGMPKRQELLEIGERWKPYRSIACWYLWRALDT